MTSPDLAKLIADYEAGATTRQLAASYGGDPSAIGKRLRAAGVQMRPRGAKPAAGDAVETVVTMRRTDHATWEQIAQATGLSVRGVQVIYERETGGRSHIAHTRDLTDRQAADLSDLLDRVPRTANDTLDWQTQAGKRWATAAIRLHGGGVTYAAIAAACGLSASQVNYARSLYSA